MPQLGQPGQVGTIAKSAPGRDTVLDRLEALEKALKALTVARSIDYTTPSPGAPIVGAISKYSVPAGTQDFSTDDDGWTYWVANPSNLSALLFGSRLPADVHPRVEFYGDSGIGLYLSDGTQPINSGWNLFFQHYDSLLGAIARVIGSTQFDKPIAIPSYPTSGRPDVSGVAGLTWSIFDSTLGKPIWWNGTNWVDATGATV